MSVSRLPGRLLLSLALFACLLPLRVIGASPQLKSELPTQPIYLWAEKPLVSPDREHIKDQRIYSVDNPSMTPFWPAPGTANGTGVVIFPGGGYVRLAINNEGYDMAKWFAAHGVAAFVVKYRMKEYGFPANLNDALRAVRLVRSKAADWQLDAHKIGVIGFSAGGHMAASAATRYDYAPAKDDPLGAVSARPDFAILGYPVINMEGEDTHVGSRTALFGDHPNPQLLHENSLQNQIKADIPPVFMFHGIADQSVPVTNSLNFFAQVQKVNKQSELHIYESSIHGVGMVQGQGTISSWSQALELWLRQRGLLAASGSR